MSLPPLTPRAQRLAGAFLIGMMTASAPAATPAAPRERRVAIEGLQQPLEELAVRDFDGRDLSGALKPETSGGRVTVSLERLDQFVVKSRRVETVRLREREKSVLPGGIVVPLVAAPDDSTPPRMAWFRLTLEASPTPATWDDAAANYTTRLTFGLRRPPQMPEGIQLQQPVIVKLGFAGMTAVDVPPLAIEGTGLENEKTVELQFRPSTAEPRVLVRSTLSDVDIDLEALTRLQLTAVPRQVLGLGLESADMVVEHVRPHGVPEPVMEATPLTIESNGRVRPEPAEVAFAAGQARATFRVRSSGLGPVTVVAMAHGRRAQVTIEQRFPTAMLVATLVGGALGGYARRFVKGARRKQAGRRVIEGVIVGLLAFVASVLGVANLGLPPALLVVEAAGFLVGAIAGFAGVSVLETMAKKTSAGT